MIDTFLPPPLHLGGQTRHPWLDQLHAVILNHLKNPNFNIPLLAKQMQISERSLHYHIKSKTGFTPAKYITEVRLLVAEQMLEQVAYPTVAEISYAVGFRRPAYFSFLFKKRFNKLPSVYLRF